jgi:hypothetical protein
MVALKADYSAGLKAERKVVATAAQKDDNLAGLMVH